MPKAFSIFSSEILRIGVELPQNLIYRPGFLTFIANREWAILFLFGSFFTIVFTCQLILSYTLQRICNLVRMPKYGHMVFGL